MSRINYFQSTCTSGEISPRLIQQKNLVGVRNGLKKQQNAWTLPYTGVQKRSGFQHLLLTKTIGPTLTLPFQFSLTDTVDIEFGEGYFRFLVQDALVTNPDGSPYELSHPYLGSELAEVQYAQSLDVVFLTHSNHPPQKLSRLANNNWTLTEHVLTGGPFMRANIDTTSTITASNANGLVTLNASLNLFAATDVGRLVQLTAGSTTGVAKITSFGSSTTVTAQTQSALPTTATDNWALGSFSQTSGYPRAITFIQQRQVLLGTRAQPNFGFTSVIGDFSNYTFGGNDDDAIIFGLDSPLNTTIMWAQTIGNCLIIGTQGAEWSLNSSDFRDLPLTPTNITAKIETTVGTSPTPPVRIGQSLIFIQAARKKVHEFVYMADADNREAFDAPDLTLLSEHITGNGISQAVWQAQPYGILWTLRDDGVLLGFTFMKSQQIFAWHRHPTPGRVMSIMVLRGPIQDTLYAIVQREIKGAIVQAHERLNPPFLREDKVNAKFYDSALSFDGLQNTQLKFYSNGQNLCAKAEAPIFAGLTNIRIKHLILPLEFKVLSIVDANTLILQSPLVALDAWGKGLWAIKVSVVRGLEHLEGATISALADGVEVDDLVVQNGQVNLGLTARIVHAGLRYLEDVETLDVEAGSQVGSSDGARGRTYELQMYFYETLGGTYSTGTGNADSLIPFITTDTHMDRSPDLFSGHLTLRGDSSYSQTRGVRIQSYNGLPMTILSFSSRINVSDA